MIELKPKVYKRDHLRIHKTEKYVHFSPYIDGTGNEFKISIADLIKFLQ